VVQLCDAKGVALVSVQEAIDTSGPMGRFTIHLFGAIAQLERETISQRTRLGMTHLKAKGAYLGRTPVGLQDVRRDGVRVLEAHPVYGDAVRRLWPMVLDGAPLMALCDHLTKQGVPTANGGPWLKTSVSMMLASERYVGLLVDSETHRVVHEVLSKRGSPGNRRRGTVKSQMQQSSNRVWRLHGIAVCGHCGAAMVGLHSTGRTGKLYPYIRCAGRMKHGKCPAVQLPAEAYEDAIVARVAEVMIDSKGLKAELIRAMAEARDGAAGAREAKTSLMMKRDRTQRKLDLMLEAVVEGGAVARAWSAKIAETQLEVERITVEMAALDGRLSAASVTEKESELLLAATLDDAAKLSEMSWEEQQRHLRSWVKQVRVTADHLDADLFVPTLRSQVRTVGPKWLPRLDSNQE
jgi:site-specific DNA recombinase